MIDLSQLDDATAERILTTIARARSISQPGLPPLLGIQDALADDFSSRPSGARTRRRGACPASFDGSGGRSRNQPCH